MAKMIKTIGDSHSCYTFISTYKKKSLNPHAHVYDVEYKNKNMSTNLIISCNWLGPITMHRIGRDGFDFDKYITDNSDLLIIFFGEIDIRMHILKQAQSGRTEEEVLNTLVENYIKRILENKKTNNFVISAVTPAAYAKFTGNNNGSDEKRSAWTKIVNSKLQKLCIQHKLSFFNPYIQYEDDNGMLINALADRVNFNHIEETKHSLNELIKLILEKTE